MILEKSINRGVTSKPNTNHMGYGLWYVNEIVTKTKGKFEMFSLNGYYRNSGGNSHANKSCYWKGSIINIELPLTNPITIKDIEKQNTNIKINFV